MKRRNSRESGGFFGAFFLVILLVVLGILYFVYSSEMFERNAPKVSLGDKINWNLKTPINVKITDDTGIKSLKISLSDGKQVVNLMDETFELIQKELNLAINLPKGTLLDRNGNLKLNIEVKDISKWKFGNKLNKEIDVLVDTKRPDVYVLNQSYKITKGGSGAVVFKASDDNLNEVYIQTSFGKKFEVVPFYKDGYFVSIIAWPVNEKNFTAYAVATDKAGNESKVRIRYYLQDKVYKTSKISLTDEFINGKISELVEIYAKDPSIYEGIEKFKFVNETLRNANEELIYSKTNKILEEKVDDFFIKPFYPLKNGAAVASFGDHRFYVKDDKDVSQSWHLGLDLASVANAQITTSNPAVVVLKADNGIYGLNLVLYHGLGLYSIYGHCSASSVEVGQNISEEEIIANTGSSGLAFGDHLHFGMSVQGVEVRPEEWMDKKWMKENIFQILDNAKKLIDNKK